MSGHAAANSLREVALFGIHRVAQSDAYLADVLQAEFERRKFPHALRGAVSTLAAGVIRRRITLDHLIAHCASRPLKQVHPLLLDVLRLGAYELLFVPHVPARAAVSEAVNLAKARVKPAFGAFANAVLRRLERIIERSAASAAASPSARTLCGAPGECIRFTEDVFADPAADPAAYLSQAGGMPRWLVDSWIGEYGLDATWRIVEASNAAPPVTLRVNVLKTTREALAEKLSAEGIQTTPGELPECLHVKSQAELTALDAFAAGEFYIQDLSAMHAARVLAPMPGERVLDLCAAPGGKATHLAELSGDRAAIVAMDASVERLKRVSQNAARLGLEGIRAAQGDARRLPEDMTAAFDAVLADVPCSNTGVLRRRVEARHRLRPEAVGKLNVLQAEILRSAISAARPGGRVVYATCSIQDEENGLLVREVLKTAPNWRLEHEIRLLPDAESADGAYVGLLCTA